MQTRDLPILILLVLGISFLLSLTFLNCEPSRSSATLTGKVECVAVDESNHVSLVAISTQTEEYVVADDANGKELFQLINKRVKVKGRLTQNEDGQPTIYVSKYELVPQ
jgi:hypothetical protein